MSSILDAVNKDAERAGRASLGASAAGDAGGNAPRPRRVLPVVAVVAVGLLVGALAARMSGEGQGETESLLTDKVDGRVVAASRDAEDPAAGQTPKGRRRADAAQRGGKNPGAGRNQGPRAAASRGKERAAGAGHQARAKAVPKAAVAASAPVPATPPPVADGVMPALEAAAPVAVPTVKPGAVTPTAVVAQPLAPVVTPQVPPQGAEEPAVQEPPVAVEEVQDAVQEPSPDPAEPDAIVGERPSGAPDVNLMFILWARDADQRMASVRVGSGAVTIIHEGQFLEGMQVSSIHADAVDFLWTGSRFRVRVGPF